MSSVGNFECLICDAKTESLQALKEHTRQHAGPVTKLKESTTTAKPGEQTACDVCPEVFDTPTKAISHKFKKHPTAPNTFFCSWCGKQFPIKNILEKHTLSHTDPEPNDLIPCEHCDSMFYNVEAAKYHITLFHKKEFMLTNYIQTPPASLKIMYGSSGDVMSAYYCQFCGNEYVLKYNLQLHIKRVHTKMNFILPPENVIICKSCNAIFYTVDAYEFHTSFHSENDLFVVSEEMRQQVVSKIDQDFDVRRVKPCQFGKRNPQPSSQMKKISEYREKIFADIGSMSSLSPPPQDTDSEEEQETKRDVKKEENVTIGQFEYDEANKSRLSDCAQTNVNDVEEREQEVKESKVIPKHKDKSDDEIINSVSDSRKTRNKKSTEPNDRYLKSQEIKNTIGGRNKGTIEKSLNKTKEKKNKTVVLENSAINSDKYGSIKFLDLKVRLERMDLEDLVNKYKKNKLPIVKPEESLQNLKKSIPIMPSPQNDKAAVKTLRKVLPPKNISNIKVKLLPKTWLDEKIISVDIKNEKFVSNASISDKVILNGSVSDKDNSLNGNVTIEPNSMSVGSISVIPISKLQDNNCGVKTPKKLIPVSSVPEKVKNVKMFRKVLIPKGLLKSDIKVLTKTELEALEKKGLIMSENSSKIIDSKCKDITSNFRGEKETVSKRIRTQ